MLREEGWRCSVGETAKGSGGSVAAAAEDEPARHGEHAQRSGLRHARTYVNVEAVCPLQVGITERWGRAADGGCVRRRREAVAVVDRAPADEADRVAIG